MGSDVDFVRFVWEQSGLDERLTWRKMFGLLHGGLDLEPLVTHHFPASRFQEGFDAMRSGQSGKVVLTWD